MEQNVDNKIENVEAKPTITNPEAVSQSQNQVDPESAQEVNWRNYRQQMEQQRKEKKEAEKRAEEKAAEAEALRRAMESILNKPQPQNNSNQYVDDDVTQEQIIERKVQEALLAKERVYEQQRIERERQDFPQRLNRTYTDFNQICSSENLDYLDYHHPEITAGYKHMPDGYEKWETVYKAVKKYVVNTDSRKDMKRMEQNLNKPGSISSSQVTPQGKSTSSHILDESKKASNWERMQRTLKGLSND